jgi:hypothetical protein
MKSFLWVLSGALVLAALPLAESQAHGPYARSRISIGFGYGFGYHGYYRPFDYYYPSPFVGVSVWPRSVVRRARTETAEDDAVKFRQLYVYPAAGQSESQMADDRYDCHVWAVDATDFDPTLGAGSAEEAEGYARALTACLEGRDYVVK